MARLNRLLPLARDHFRRGGAVEDGAAFGNLVVRSRAGGGSTLVRVLPFRPSPEALADLRVAGAAVEPPVDAITSFHDDVDRGGRELAALRWLAEAAAWNEPPRACRIARYAGDVEDVA